MPRRSLSEWLGLLQQRHPTEIDLGLTRINRVAQLMQLVTSGHLPPVKTLVTVGGTNGKGSCVAALNALLTKSGYRVGCYTSPHLIRYNERIVINGQMASDEAICDAFERIEQARGDISLTYFEFGTLAALILMADAAVDVAILEVGLGGRLDAVNILDADIAIVTSIALDHQDWLGDDLDQIGAEKAAIARAGRPLICGDRSPNVGVLKTATATSATLLVNGRDFDLNSVASMPANRLPPNSVACALQAMALISDLPFDRVDTSALGAVSVPGRFQQLQVGSVPVILDVAHNPQAAELLAERLLLVKGHIVAVVGMMSDKDIIGSLAPLIPLVKAWCFCDIPDQPRAATAGKLQALLYNAGALGVGEAVCCPSPLAAFDNALKLAAVDDTVVVFGSFFTVGPILEHLQYSCEGTISVD
ncbi:bifunctional folylpolyglutamate synthase/dihydrofolate synthase [Porticoccus sp.]